MSIRHYLARHPQRLDTQYPLFIEDLLRMAEHHKNEAISTCLKMCEDFYLNGSLSPYVQPVPGSPLFALESPSNAQNNANNSDGVIRVYFYWRSAQEAVLVHAEALQDAHPSLDVLSGCAAVWKADLQGVKLLDGGISP